MSKGANKLGHNWSKEEIEKVRDLTFQGHTSAETAKVMSLFIGREVTVNSIERIRKTHSISIKKEYQGMVGGELGGSKETNEIEGDKWTISLPTTRIHTLEELVAYCQIDLVIWEVERFVCNKWEVGVRGSSGDPVVIAPLFQVKAFLKKKVHMMDARAEIEELKREASNFRLPVKVERKKVCGGHLLEMCIADHHFGKLAWGEETGHGNYDVRIAKDIYTRALDGLIDRTGAFKFEEILFVVGNDLLNADDVDNKTTWGTPQTTDGRYQKTFAVVRTLVTEAIEKLRLVAPVNVMMIPGNHDRLSVWHLGDSLECWFHKYTDVKIDNRPLYRKYYRFGDVMLMFTHGDKGVKSNYPLLMATEQPQMFGETKFREIHTAHTHQVGLKEQNGVRVRILPSLGPPDDWHSDKGFVGNLKSSEAFVWDKKEGLTSVVFYSETGKVRGPGQPKKAGS